MATERNQVAVGALTKTVPINRSRELIQQGLAQCRDALGLLGAMVSISTELSDDLAVRVTAQCLADIEQLEQRFELLGEAYRLAEQHHSELAAEQLASRTALEAPPLEVEGVALVPGDAPVEVAPELA